MLGLFYKQTADYLKADSLLLQSMEMIRRTKGNDDYNLAKFLAKLGVGTFVDLRRAMCLTEALEILHRTKGEDVLVQSLYLIICKPEPDMKIEIEFKTG